MTFWNNRAASEQNLRYYESGLGWVAFDDVMDSDGKIVFKGCHSIINQTLTAGLNATNLVLLTGAGASFCVTNSTDTKRVAPSMRTLWDAVKAEATDAVFKEILALIPKASGTEQNIEKLLTQCKLYIELFEDENSKKIADFIIVAEDTIAKLVDFVDGKSDVGFHANAIRRIGRRGHRKPRTKVFTTNYDLCFEYAAMVNRFTIIDGFSRSLPQTYDRSHYSYDVVRRDGSPDAPDYLENVFHLYKLHGSLDWRRDGAEIVKSRTSSTNSKPLMIFPRASKYQESYDPPYLDMMSAFQTALREPDTTLVVSGFGFNDDHISQPIMAAIEANMSLRLIVCDIAFLDDATLLSEDDSQVKPHTSPPRFENPVHIKLKRLVDIGDKRINLINGRFEDLSVSLPDLVSQTERERHAERILVLRDAANGGP